MHAEIAQNRADLTYAFKICRVRTPGPSLLSTLSLTVRNFKKTQATPITFRVLGVCTAYPAYAVRMVSVRVTYILYARIR